MGLPCCHEHEASGPWRRGVGSVTVVYGHLQDVVVLDAGFGESRICVEALLAEHPVGCCRRHEVDVGTMDHRLKQSGVAPWLSKEDVLPGDDLEPAIRKALLSADLVIVFLSQRCATSSGAFDQEIAYALEIARAKPHRRSFVIPARLELCPKPGELKRYDWVDLFDAVGYAALLDTLASERIQRRPVFHEGNS